MKRQQPRSVDTLSVRLSVPDDITYLAPRLRKADLDSLLACASPSAEVSLTRGLHYSDICLTALDDSDSPVVMFGTVPFPQDSSMGNVWFLTAGNSGIEPDRLIATANHYVEIFHEKYPILSSLMDCRDRSRKRMLRRCGFEFGNMNRGPVGHNLQEAYKIRIDKCVSQ